VKIIFLVSVIICNIYPQYEILDSAPVELFVLTLSSSETDTFRYSITAIGSVWKADNTHPPSNYTMTSDFNRVIYPPYDNPPLSRTDWNAYEDWAGYDFIIGSQAIPPPWPYRMPNFAWGLYKIKMLYGDDYFYLNFRDQNYSQYSSYCNGHCADVWVKYDSDQDMFSFVTQSNTDPYSSDWVDASGGKLFFIWEIKNQWPSTSNFPDYWQNCLVLIPTSDNHPRLVWGPYPERKQGGCSLFC
jgi:hypothetical protein